MGLLSKVEGKEKPVEITAQILDENIPDPREISSEHELDEKGKALINRIHRIPPGSSAPYTALSLLKAYGSFQAGICFTLEKGFYTNFTSVGLGIQKNSIPQDKIYFPERARDNYFQFSADEKQEIKAMDSGLDLWCFPLGMESPWNAVLILGCTGSSSFNSNKISLILKEIGNVIIPKDNSKPNETEKPETPVISPEELSAEAPPVEELPAEASLTEEPPAELASETVEKDDDSPPNNSGIKDGLEVILEHHYKINSSIDGMIINIPPAPAEQMPASNESVVQTSPAGFESIVSMVSHFASVEELTTGSCLVLLNSSLDRELIAHRLGKNLHTEIPLIFNAASPAEALQIIRPYC